MSINLWFDYYNIMSSEYWVNIINGLGTDVSYSVTTDINRNIYTAGSVGAGHSNVHYLSSDIFAAIPPHSGYIVKFDPYGLPLWRSFVSNTLLPATNIVTSNTVITYSSTSVYTCGSSIGFSNIYDKNGTSVGFVPRNSGYIVKYDIDGNFVWRAFVANTQSGITTTGAVINSVAVDSSENVYAFGATGLNASNAIVNSNIFSSGDTFPTPSSIVGFRQTVVNNPQAYVIKFNSSGDFQWRAFIDNLTTAGQDIPTSGTVDSNGDVYVCGHTGVQQATIYTSAVTPTSTLTIPLSSAFLVKYDSSGSVKWRAYIDDFNSLTGTADQSQGVAVDNLNNVYIVGKTGSQTGVSNIFNSNIYSTTLSPVTIPIILGSSTAYIVKYGPTGNFLWRAYVDGALDINTSVVTDSDRNVIVCGSTGGSVATIVNSSGTFAHNIPASSSFVIKYDENGYVLNSYHVSGSLGNSVTTDSYKNIISVGTSTVNGFVYNSNVDSNCFTGYTIPQSSSFITKHNQDGVIPFSTGLYRTPVSNGWDVNWSNSTPCVSLGCFVSPDGLSVYKVGSIGGSTVSVISNADGKFSGYTIPSSTGCIVKYDENGNFKWRSYVLGTSPSFTCVDGNNSYVYVGGNSGTSTSSLHDIYGNINTTLQANTGFINRYNSDGTIIQKAYVSNSTINSIFYTSLEDSVYVSGLTHPTFTSNIVDSTNLVVGDLQPNTGFIFKLNSTLSNIWSVKFKPVSGTSICPITSISTSGSTSIYASGYSNSIVQVNYTNSDSSSGTLLPVARANAAFVTKFTNLGSFQWKSYVDSTTAGSQELGTGVVTDSSNVFFTGFTGSGPASAYNNNDTIYGDFRTINATAGFLLKYDTNGNLLWYSNLVGGTAVTSNCVKIDSNGDVYIGGKGGTTTASTLGHSNIYGSISSGVTTGIDTAYISKYDGRTGRFIWRSYIDGTGIDVLRSISIDSSNYIYTAGYSTGTTGTSTVYSSNTNATNLRVPASSSFMIKYKPNGAIIF